MHEFRYIIRMDDIRLKSLPADIGVAGCIRSRFRLRFISAGVGGRCSDGVMTASEEEPPAEAVDAEADDDVVPDEAPPEAADGEADADEEVFDEAS